MVRLSQNQFFYFKINNEHHIILCSSNPVFFSNTCMVFSIHRSVWKTWHKLSLPYKELRVLNLASNLTTNFQLLSSRYHTQLSTWNMNIEFEHSLVRIVTLLFIRYKDHYYYYYYYIIIIIIIKIRAYIISHLKSSHIV